MQYISLETTTQWPPQHWWDNMPYRLDNCGCESPLTSDPRHSSHGFWQNSSSALRLMLSCRWRWGCSWTNTSACFLTSSSYWRFNLRFCQVSDYPSRLSLPAWVPGTLWHIWLISRSPSLIEPVPATDEIRCLYTSWTSGETSSKLLTETLSQMTPFSQTGT